jgi:hypothetical protein
MAEANTGENDNDTEYDYDYPLGVVGVDVFIPAAVVVAHLSDKIIKQD